MGAQHRQARSLALLLALVSQCICAQAQAVPSLLLSDPENLFDVFQPGRVVSIKQADGSSISSTSFDAVMDGKSDTTLGLALPSSGVGTSGKAVLQVSLKTAAPVLEISLRFNRADGHSKGNFLPCLSMGTWVRSNSTNMEAAVSTLAANSAGLLRTLPNRQDHPNYNPTAVRASWLAPVNEPVLPATVFTLVLPKACATSGLQAGIAEVQMFRPVNLAVFGSSVGLFDDHFHPCSFSNQCTDVKDIVAEQKRQGVWGAFLFGLQHNLMKAASPWITAVFGKNKGDPENPEIDPTPYHYDDLGAQPSYKPTAKPGVDQVNLRRAAYGLTNITGYPGWPMWSNSLADWNTISQYYKLVQANSPGVKGHAYPFLSSMRIDEPPGYTLYTVCTKADGSAWTINEMLIRAMDTMFPSSVFGYQEYNINKTVVAQNNVFAPVLSADWKKCMSGVFAYLEQANRPFGMHADIKPWTGEQALMALAREFKNTIMVWDHGGFAPEVDKRLAASDHIQLMKDFISTSPSKRYIDFSWNTGFWLRFMPDKLGNVEMNSKTMTEQPRNWVEDCKAYMAFINDYPDQVMFGSDQVSLNYPDSLSRDLKGGVIYNRPGYFQAAADYGASLRQEVGLLYNCMNVAVKEGGEKYRLSSTVVSKLFYNNAKKLADGVKHPVPGTSCQTDGSKSRKEGPGDACFATGVSDQQARQFMRNLFEMQWKELREGAGDDAPTLDQFLPAMLK